MATQIRKNKMSKSHSCEIDIRELRKDLDLTADDLAKILGVVGVTVFRWQSDKIYKVRPFTIRILRLLEKAAGIDPNLKHKIHDSLAREDLSLALFHILNTIYGEKKNDSE